MTSSYFEKHITKLAFNKIANKGLFRTPIHVTDDFLTYLGVPTSKHFSGNDSTQPGHIFILGGMLSKHSCVTDHVECWREEDDHWIMGVASLPHAVCGLAALVLPHDIMD